MSPIILPRPFLIPLLKPIHVPTDVEEFKLELPEAKDAEEDDLSYSCSNTPRFRDIDLSPAREFIFLSLYATRETLMKLLSFTYKASDGQASSSNASGKLSPVTLRSAVVQLSIKGEHNCVLFDRGNLRCWGYDWSSYLMQIERFNWMKILCRLQQGVNLSALFWHQAKLSVGETADLDNWAVVYSYTVPALFFLQISL